jgi:hypothetical protein
MLASFPAPVLAIPPTTVAVLGFRELWPIWLVGCFLIAVLPFWIWMIVDCINKESKEGNDRVLWLLVILLAHWIGALIYFLFRRPARIRELGR